MTRDEVVEFATSVFTQSLVLVRAAEDGKPLSGFNVAKPWKAEVFEFNETGVLWKEVWREVNLCLAAAEDFKNGRGPSLEEMRAMVMKLRLALDNESVP